MYAIRSYYVSNANEDFPEPLRPVKTMKRSRGIFTLMFFRLCSLAPTMAIERSSTVAGNLGFAASTFFNKASNGEVDLLKYGRRYTPVSYNFV